MLQVVTKQPSRPELLERLGSPRARAYEIDRLAERYRSALRALRDGADLSAVVHGLGASLVSPLAPIGIAKADGRSVGSYYCADLGASIATGGIAPWSDLWGSNPLSSVTTTQRAQQVQEATLFRRASITGDGVDDWYDGGPNPPVPGTTPYTMRLVVRCNAWVSGGRLIGGTIRNGTSSGTVEAFNTGAFVTTALTMTDGVWYRMRLYSSNSAADYYRVGSSLDTTNLGNGDRAILPVFSAASGPSLVGSFSLANWLYAEGADLSAPADVLLDRYYRIYYGPNVTLG